MAAFDRKMADSDQPIGNDSSIHARYQAVGDWLQLALNQRVRGSIPCASTNLFNRLGGSTRSRNLPHRLFFVILKSFYAGPESSGFGIPSIHKASRIPDEQVASAISRVVRGSVQQ